MMTSQLELQHKYNDIYEKLSPGKEKGVQNDQDDHIVTEGGGDVQYQKIR